jgi:hypothetical protein
VCMQPFSDCVAVQAYGSRALVQPSDLISNYPKYEECGGTSRALNDQHSQSYVCCYVLDTELYSRVLLIETW